MPKLRLTFAKFCEAGLKTIEIFIKFAFRESHPA